MIDLLRDWQVLLLVASAVLTLGLAVLLWLRLRRLRLAPLAQVPVMDLLAAPREAMVLTPALMRQAFRNGLSEYRQAVAGSSNPYLVPWVLAVGTRGGGTSALCAAGGSARPPATVPDPATGKPLGCAWWFYDRAVVIDVAGEAFADMRGERLPDVAWIALLEELTRARDGLPLDGILLTLPVPDLAGPEALPAATLAAKAAEIHTRLWQVQKVTGLTLPVWLVLTMGDAIPGFQQLLAALPPEAQDSAFGWSSPYPLEASFQSAWIGEAMDSLQDAAAAAGLELGAAGAGEETAAAAMRLPVELDHLRGPLATFLGVLFRQTGYQESLFFRGLWLTGAVGPAPAADQPPPLGFVRGVLRQKIFAERDLPRPVPRWSLLQGRRRAIWRGAVGVAAAVLALVLWSGVGTLEQMRAGFTPALRALAGPVAAAQETTAGAAPTEGAGPLAAIRGMARLGSGWQDPLWPIAALDATADRVRTALAIGHWRLVMGEIRATLLRRAQALAEGESQAPAPPGGAPELRELRRFLGEALLLERYVLTFNRLGAGGGTVGLAELLHYTHGIELPAAYVDRAAELGFAELPSAAALRGATVEAGAQPIDAAILRASLQSRLLALAQSYLARQVPPAESLELQRQAAARLAALAEAGGPGAAARLEEAAQALEAALVAARRDAPGLVAEGALGGSEFQALLRVVGDSRLLGSGVRDALLRAAQAPADAEAVGTVAAIGIGPLLAAAPERNRLEPAAPAAALQGQFAALLARPFMQAATPIAVPAARTALFRWNIPALEAAAALVDDHALFQLRDLPEFPTSFRPAVQRAAQERLGAGLVAAVARAQLPAEGRDMAPVVAAARAAHPVLLRLMVALRAGAAPEDAAALAGVVTQQAQRLLDAGWAQLEAGAGYQPPPSGQLAWAEGKLDPAALYGLADAAMLPALLGRERDRLQRLAELAQPMLGVLAAPELGGSRPPAIAARWLGLSEELQRAGQGRAGSLAGLERMIGQDLAAVTPGNCADLPLRGGGDWFTEQAVRLRARLRSLCQTQTATRAAGAWEALEENFTRLLAGRYPFAPLAAAERGPHATAERVAEFYAGFEAQADAALAPPPADPALAARARRFITQMREAHGFLKPLLGLDGTAPGLVLVPRFRALPERESGGDAVIEWRLAGRGVFTGTMSGQRPVPWKIGDPLSLSLRWARNAPVQPVQLLPSGPRAEAGTITITARDPWALVTLARRLVPDAADWRPGPGEPGPVLAFSVQTAEAGEPPRTAAPALVFTSLGITAQAAPTGPRLAWPSFPTDWPAAAPRATLAASAP
jgi:type VI secretion system protein ImpL